MLPLPALHARAPPLAGSTIPPALSAELRPLLVEVAMVLGEARTPPPGAGARECGRATGCTAAVEDVASFTMESRARASSPSFCASEKRYGVPSQRFAATAGCS